MEDFLAILSIIAALLLRIGIPLAVTAILVIALRRVDERWQREAELGTGSETKHVSMFSQFQCWMTHNCSEENRDECPAFIENNKPCWQVFRDGSGDLRQKCLDCPVFVNVPAGIPV
jgi:hypothetical protein